MWEEEELQKKKKKERVWLQHPGFGSVRQLKAPQPRVFAFIATAYAICVVYFKFNCLDGRVLRVSASGAVDSGLIPSRVKPMTLELVFTAFLYFKFNC